MSASTDFQPIHSAIKRYVDGNLLAGVSCAVLRGQDLLDVHHVGLADKENGVPMRDNTIFRAFSNTKLIATIAALQLWQAGKFQLHQRHVDECMHRGPGALQHVMRAAAVQRVTLVMQLPQLPQRIPHLQQRPRGVVPQPAVEVFGRGAQVKHRRPTVQQLAVALAQHGSAARGQDPVAGPGDELGNHLGLQVPERLFAVLLEELPDAAADALLDLVV